MRYQLDEDKGDLLYEVENDNLILKIKPEVIASIGTPGTGGSGSGIYFSYYSASLFDGCGRKHGYLYETFSFRASYQCCFELFSDLWSWRAASPWRYRCRRFGGNYVLFRTADVPLCDS